MLRVVRVKGHTFIADFVSPGGVVLDLGAHLGEFLEEIHRRLGCICHALEPAPDLFARIPESPGIRKSRLAVDAAEGPVTLYLARNPEGHSLLVDHHGSAQGVAVVPATTLGAFLHAQRLDRIELLKVDIEGAEIAMFRSLEPEVLSRIKQMTVEFHDFLPSLALEGPVEEVTRDLVARGFACFPFSWRDRADVLFVNKALCPVSRADAVLMRSLVRYGRGAHRILARLWGGPSRGDEAGRPMDAA